MSQERSESTRGVSGRYDELLAVTRELASRNGLTIGSGLKTAVVGALLCSNICERKIKYSLEHQTSNRYEKFDPLFTAKSDYATLKIVDHIKSRLDKEQVLASITCESQDETGAYDVLIESSNPSGTVPNHHTKIKLEVKAGLGVALEQVERYLWEPSPLVLIRVMSRQVIRLDPSELNEFLNFAVAEDVQKAKRLLGGKYHTVPGKYCAACMDFACEHNKFRPPKEVRMIQFSDTNAQEDLNLFLRNLAFVAEKAASLVIQELQEEEAKDGNQAKR